MTLTPDPSWAAFYAHLEESLRDVQAHCALQDLEAAEDTVQVRGGGDAKEEDTGAPTEPLAGGTQKSLGHLFHRC